MNWSLSSANLFGALAAPLPACCALNGIESMRAHRPARIAEMCDIAHRVYNLAAPAECDWPYRGSIAPKQPPEHVRTFPRFLNFRSDGTRDPYYNCATHAQETLRDRARGLARPADRGRSGPARHRRLEWLASARPIEAAACTAPGGPDPPADRTQGGHAGDDTWRAAILAGGAAPCRSRGGPRIFHRDPRCG